MELILWRHADAEDGAPDFERKLTRKGEAQAARMARWLKPHLGPRWRVLASPARRARQTAEALGVAFEVSEALDTGTTADALLREIGWPDAGGGVLVVGHQPTLGQVAARLMKGEEGDVSVRKGAAWWFATRKPAGEPGAERETVLKAVMNPDLLDD